MVVPKKNGKLRVCVNLKNVNAATIRDNYPLPIVDHVIERVAGKKAYSFLDGFCICNRMGHICISGYAVWINQCTSHIPKVDVSCIQGISKDISRGI